MANKGLGNGGSGLGSSRVLQQPEDFSEGSLGWETLARAITDPLADSWFEDYKPQPASKVLGKNAFLNQDRAKRVLAPAHLGGEEVLLIPDLVRDAASLGEQITLEESEVGRALIEALTRNGISWTYRTSFAVDPFNSIELEDARFEGLAQWGTFFGMPISQHFSVYRNAQGSESVYWSAPMLVSTRAFTHISQFTFGDEKFDVSSVDLKKGALPYGEWSTKLVLPALFKCLFFLSETPFPSQIMSLSRSIAFKDIEPKKFPKPTIVHHKNHFVQGAFASSGDSFQASGTMMPDVIEAGWLFSTTDQGEIQTILEVVTNGLVRMATYLEDGYLNYRTKDYPFPYDDALLAGVVIGSGYEPGISALGRSQWVPGVRIGLILNETNELVHAFYRDPEHNSHSNTYRKQAELIVYEGAGALVPSMCNTYVFCWLLKDGSYDEIERVLDSPIRLEIPRETTNAMSNLGISKYMSGDSDRAIQLFTDALAREDGEAEAEASFYLSRIYAGQSNKTKATEFEARCAAAGGYETFDGSDRIDATDGTPAPARSGGAAGGGALPKSSKQSLGGSVEASGEERSGDRLGKKNGGGLGSLSTSTDDASPGLSKTNGSGLGGPASSSESQLPKASSGGGSAKFCPSCGNAFTSPEQKFCPECGIPRP